jgi:hypothetical protein
MSSNKVMNLFEAMSIARLKGTYRMHGDIIFLSIGHLHAKFGEIIFSLLGQSYVGTGKG